MRGGCIPTDPNDPRNLRDTGRTWNDGEFSGPIMADPQGREYEVIKGSVADFTNGRLARILERMGGEEDILRTLGAAKPPPGGWRVPSSAEEADALNDLPDWAKED